MARINLLPWREELRAQQQKDFVVQVVLAAVFGAAIWGLWHMQMAGMIENQNSRNSFLQAEIKKLDKEIREINDLEKTKTNLLARMNVIQELQSNRPMSVHLMDELVRTLPDGVHLTQFQQNSTNLTINGVAQSNARVSAYMRNIDGSDWLANPGLQVIETRKNERSRTAEFTLTAKQRNAQADADKDAGGDS
ncbi:PilN domain-containing protein [Thiohalobacter thiocyanaticus]|uniref:Pilus assembly protein PilN n=1 Tax=Thiohalobacter thiocyanaticus TaxID=585455 RepID=A0A426QK10_9GAMM|nr:PilN domain-containing protein [Thiohalobacter thiocyanaticus]RRQ22080.1 pilus assembly protein PilN [Thiohalobacter thiocyanaticus]